MRRKRQAIRIRAADADVGDLLFERNELPNGETLHWCLGRVTGKGNNLDDETIDLWINSYVDPPDSGWYQFHRDEEVTVVRAVRAELPDAGTRRRPRI